MDSLRIFFSYSSVDKEIVGALKKQLEFMGFEVFLAHDDIEPSVEWQEEIIKNLKSCVVFISLLTKSFKGSEWTDQETGMAIISDKFIIPLQVESPPYGFIGRIQSLQIKLSDIRNEDPKYVEDSFKYYAEKIAKVIINKFGENMKSFVINNFIRSKNFYQANARVKLLEYFPDYNPEQVSQIFSAAIDNKYNFKAYNAKKILTNIFKKYKVHLNLTEKEIKDLWS